MLCKSQWRHFAVQAKILRRKRESAKHTSTTEAESVFFCFVTIFHTAQSLNEDYDYVVSVSILVGSFLETGAVGSSLRGLQNVQGLGL